MAKYSNTVEYNIRTTLDSSGIAKLQAELTQLQNHVAQLGAKELMPSTQVSKTLGQIKQIQTALTQAFNPKLGMLNSSAFMKNISAMGLSMNEVYKTFSNIGPAGQRAFTSMYGSISKIDTGLRSVSNTTDKIMNTLGNTVRWGLIASGFAAVMNSVHEAARYVSDLDKSLTNIMMVSGETRDTMNEFAKSANDVAKRLGGTTVQMTEATKVFIQQGLTLEESQKMGEYAVHLANVSEQDSAVASDEITAYRNAFKIDLEDMGNAISKWAAVANKTAVDVEELSIASQKAASVAATVGVDLDQFAGHIAAIESVTREAPENIGNGLKTIYSRIADISLGETLEDGVNLGSFAKALEKVGVDVLDQTGKLRDAGIILEDLMGVWQNLDQTQRAAVAKTVAGRFQLARFEALMNRADIYEQAANTSRAETGTETYDRMQETYRESLEGRSKALQASIEEIFLNIFTTDDFYGAIDALQKLVDTINDLTEATGGGQTALLGIANAFLMISKNAMARGVSNMITNTQARMQAKENIQNTQQMAQAQLMRQGLSGTDVRTARFANDIASVNQYAGLMNEEQIHQANAAIKERTEVELQLSAAIERREKLESGLRAMLAATGETSAQTTAQMINLAESLERNGVEVTKTNEVYVALHNKLRSTGEIYNQFLDTLTAGNQNFQVTQEQAGKLAEYLKELDQAGLMSAEQSKKLSSALQVLSKVEDGSITSAKGMDEALKQFGITLEFIDNALTITPEKLQQLIEALARAKVEEEAAGAAAQAAGEKMQFMAHGLQIQSMVQGIASFGNAMMTAIFAVQSFNNLLTIMNDETKSPFEKFSAGAMDFAMVLAMGGPLISQLIGGIKGFTAGIQAFRVAQTAATAQKIADNTVTVVQIGLTQEEIREKIKLAAVEGTLTEEQIAQLSAETGLSAAKIIDIAATEGLTVAMGQLGVAVWTALAPMLPFIAAAAAVGLVVWGIIEAVRAADAEFHAFDIAVDQAGETLDQAKAKFKEAQQGLTDVKNALDKIKNSDDTFDGLTAGTLEWTEALYAANQQVLDLVDKYPELAQYITTGENGQMILNGKGQEKAVQLAQQDVAIAQVQELLARQNYIIAKDNQTALNAARAEFENIIRANTSVETSNTGDFTYAQVNTNNQAIADNIKQLANDYREVVNSGNKELVDQFIEEHNLTAQQITALENVNAALDQNTAALNASRDVTSAAILSSEKGFTEANEIGQQAMINALNEREIALQSEINNGWADQEMAKKGLTWDSGTLQDWAVKNNIFGQGVTYSNNKWYKDGEEYQELNESRDQYEQIRAAYVAKALEEALAAEAPNIAKTISALSKDQQQALLDFQQNKTMMINGEEQNFADYLSSQGITSIDQFIAALNNGSLALENFADATNPMNDSHSLSDLEYDFEKTSMVGQDQEYHDKQVESMTATEAEKWDLDVEDIVDQAEALQDVLESVDENFELTEGRARALAIQNQRMAKGLDTLTKNWEDWSDALQEVNKGSVDYINAAQDLTKCIADLVGAEEGLDLSKEFFDSAENMEYLAQAAEGDIDAVNRLGIAVAQDLVSQMEPLKEFSGLDFSDADGEQAWYNMVDSFNQAKDTVIGGLENLQANLDSVGFGENVYDQLGGADWVNALNEMAAATGMSVEQMNSMLNSMGVQTDVTTIEQTLHRNVPEYTTEETIEVISEPSEDKPGQYRKTSHTYQSGSVPVDEVVQVAQINTGDSAGTPPSINYVGNGGSPRPSRSGGGGGKGGGGGGGGGSKTKSVEKAKGAESDNDIYNKVNSKLEELADNYTEVDKAKGRAYGDKYRKAAEKEINNLQKQNALLRERNKISEAKKQALISGQDNPDYGIYLKGESLAKYGLTDADNDGTIDNYIQKYNEALAKQNAAQKAADDYWNSLGGEMNEDQQEHYKKLQEAQKDAAEYANKILDVTNEYQEVCDKIRDDTEQILENEHEMEDIAIDLFQTATKTVDTLKDLNESKGWLQGLFTNRESDSPFRALVEDLNLLEGLFGTTTTNANLFFKTMIDGATDAASKQFWIDARDQAQNKFGNGTSILDMRQFYLEKLLSQEGRNIYGSNEKQYYEDLQDLYNDIIGDMKDVESKYEDVLDDIIDAYDELADRMEFRNEQLEYELNFLEHQRDMIELIHGDESYDMFGIVNQAQVEGTLQKVNEAKLQYDYWVRERDKYNKETQKELWEEMDKKAREFGEALTDATKEAADAMAKQYEDATEAVIQHFRDELFGGTLGDAGFFEKEWEMANDQAEQYLDNVERGMELEKLRGRVQKIQDDVIDATDQKYADRAKAILKALEDQKKAIINNQGELEYVNALSQFDVDLANAKIEALQKQIALEEAQRNKNQMQLRRDTQGNYRYVYRANQDDILSAQEELADSEYEIYEMSKERYSDILNERWQVQQEYEDKVRFANERYKDDQDKLNKALNEINEWYVERQVNLGLELKDAQEGMIEGVQHLAEDTSDYVSQMFEDIADSMQENWADTLEQIGVIYSAELHNLTEDTDKFRERVQQAQDETITAAEIFDDKLRVLEDTAETSFSNIDEIINDVTKDMSSLNESTEEFMRIIRGDTGEIDDATMALERYQKQIESLQSSSSALASSLRQAQNELNSKTREAANYKTQIEKVSKGDGYFDKDGVYHDNPKSTSGSNNNGYTDSQIAWGIAQNIWTYGSWGNDPDRHSRITARYGEAIANLTQQYINEYASTGDLVNWGSDVWGYATGGYTGTWVDGSKDTEGGKLALLHQKELVLNAQDTENLLGAVDIVRQIINNMKNTDALNMPSMFGVNSNIGDNIEQRVEIVAEFPNVDTAEDIREALLSLADNAFQYAYKTR